MNESELIRCDENRVDIARSLAGGREREGADVAPGQEAGTSCGRGSRRRGQRGLGAQEHAAVSPSPRNGKGRGLPDGSRRCAWCGEPFEPRMARQRFCGERCRRDWDNMRGQAERELARMEREAEAEEERLRDLARERVYAGLFSDFSLFSTDDMRGWNEGREIGKVKGKDADTRSVETPGGVGLTGGQRGGAEAAGSAEIPGGGGKENGANPCATGEARKKGKGRDKRTGEGASRDVGAPGGWPWPLWTCDPWSVDAPDSPGTEGITANALVDAVPW